MTVEENKILVRRYFDEAPHNPDVCDEIYAQVFSFHTIQHAAVTPQMIESTPQGEKESCRWLEEVWSSAYRFTVEEMIAEGDRVVVRWTFHGTHQGEYAGLSPTRRQVSYSGINIFRIADGRIAEIWDIYDRLWLWQQLGVLPDIKDAIAKARERMSSAKAG